MNKESVTIKVWIESRKLLRLISAMTGESILAVVHRLASEEWKRLQDDTSTQDQAKPDA